MMTRTRERKKETRRFPEETKSLLSKDPAACKHFDRNLRQETKALKIAFIAETVNLERFLNKDLRADITTWRDLKMSLPVLTMNA